MSGNDQTTTVPLVLTISGWGLFVLKLGLGMREEFSLVDLFFAGNVGYTVWQLTHLYGMKLAEVDIVERVRAAVAAGLFACLGIATCATSDFFLSLICALIAGGNAIIWRGGWPKRKQRIMARVQS